MTDRCPECGGERETFDDTGPDSSVDAYFDEQDRKRAEWHARLDAIDECIATLQALRDPPPERPETAVERAVDRVIAAWRVYLPGAGDGSTAEHWAALTDALDALAAARRVQKGAR